MVRWVVGSILHGGPIELFLLSATSRITKAVVCTIMSVVWCMKRTLAANRRGWQRVSTLAIFVVLYHMSDVI